MARETKVGLLAGLAFIICFAVILANRGRPVSTPTSPTHLVDGGTRARQAAETVAQRSVETDLHATPSHRPPSERRDAGAARRDSGASQVDAASRGSPAVGPAGSGAEVSLPPNADPRGNRPVSHVASAATDLSKSAPGGTETDGSALAMATRPTNGPSLVSSSSPDEVERRRALQEYLDTADRRSAGTGTRDAAPAHPEQGAPPGPVRSTAEQTRSAVTGPATTVPSRAPSAGTVHHTVAPRDTLTSIAATYYGTASPSVVAAIYEANRAVLSSPDRLTVGNVLTIPIVGGQTPGSGTGGSPAAPARIDGQAARPARTPATAPSTGGSGPTFRWYQVQKNDRYASIAREQLGDANRWREIYELNRDKFPDPQYIREGVRIKLPVESVSVASEGRR